MAATLQIIGYKKSGKTTVTEALIKALSPTYRVAAIKHDAHQAAMDKAGTDSDRFAQAGAHSVVLQSDNGLFFHQTADAPTSAADLAQWLPDQTDFLLIEGFKPDPFPKIALLRASDSRDDFKDYQQIQVFASLTPHPEATLVGLPAIIDWVLANILKGTDHMTDELTHFNDQNRAKMVDVTDKQVTHRVAVATGQITMQPETLDRIHQGQIKKGDVLAVAQVAGIMAAKQTSNLIPMCHLIPLTGVDIHFEDNDRDTITVNAQVKTKHVTGVEIEALLAVQTTLLTIYDMCKAIDRGMLISNVHLVEKDGGKSGHFIYQS
ncbi:molybdenum cofactor biosynthesis protein C [Secundilactobacillus mixtipabuli]|uniref:Cyclic pyranopterin monophosphate synthase n=2 Tax=Secundilactobacillus mixtipabuli TaxID=1435342 RepID=A0A1Z5ICG6_9LACO|nr:molybdenum cofactor biosynthesis protein C [Secundilactobacillus mixtipabuli]